MLIDAPQSSVSYFHTTAGLARVEDILRIRGMSLADADGLKSLPGLLEGAAISVDHAKPATARLQLPDRGARGETVTWARKKPHQFAEDPDPFVVIGLDAEWVYESAGKNLILSYQFALLNDDSGGDDQADRIPEQWGDGCRSNAD